MHMPTHTHKHKNTCTYTTHMSRGHGGQRKVLDVGPTGKGIIDNSELP